MSGGLVQKGRREKREDLLEVGEVRFLLCRIHRLGGIDSVVLTTYSIPMNRLFPLEVSKLNEMCERERRETTFYFNSSLSFRPSIPPLENMICILN